MRISFDIDGTLVDCAPALLNEIRPPWLFRPWFRELLRRDTVRLFQELVRRGCEVWIYTTSDRSALYLKLWFRSLGVRLDGVVNQLAHARMVNQRPNFESRVPSKYPPAFGIDLHIDDSDGVALEGKRHGFDVLVISPNDSGWTDLILATVARKMRSAAA